MDFFGQSAAAREAKRASEGDFNRTNTIINDLSNLGQSDLNFEVKSSGVAGTITIGQEVFKVRIPESCYNDLKAGTENEATDFRGMPISGIEITAQEDAPVVQRLQGFVRMATNRNLLLEDED